MEDNYSLTSSDNQLQQSDLQIVRYFPFYVRPGSNKSWFDIRVFYVRISNFLVNESTPELLGVSYIPLLPDTLLEVNGVRDDGKSDSALSTLRRDRFDRKSDETTFVCTDRVRTTGSVKFDVFDKNDLILSGILEMSKSSGNKWRMDCEPVTATGSGFLWGKQSASLPSFDVYITGSFAGAPVLLSKTLKIGHRKRATLLNAIPEYDTKDDRGNGEESCEMEKGGEEGMEEEVYWKRTEYVDGEEVEVSWFNAGVRVGVGIGLGICVGIGIGVGLILQSYQSTSRTFKRRL